MIFLYAAIFVLIFTLILIKLSKYYRVLLNYNGEPHQKYVFSKTTPLVGGCTSLFFIFIFADFSLLIKFYLLSLFAIGILADLKLLNSPSKRLILQFLLILFFLYLLGYHLTYTRFQLLDFFLRNIFFSFFFTAFCLSISTNGTNLIDGNNLIVLGYYFIISFLIFILNKNGFSTVSELSNYLLMELIIILIVFNSLNKIYLGDSGSLLFGSIFGLILIEFYLKNSPRISSFFIVLLLWYPAFENLFSIIRKFYFSKSPLDPDNNHLHHLLYFYLTKKLSWNKVLINNSVGIIINFYNFIILVIGAAFPNHTQFMIFLIFLNIILYLCTFFSLFKFKNLYLKK